MNVSWYTYSLSFFFNVTAQKLLLVNETLKHFGSPYIYMYRTECVLDVCKSRRCELENDLKQIIQDLKVKEDHIRQLEHETQVRKCTLRKKLAEKKCFYSFNSCWINYADKLSRVSFYNLYIITVLLLFLM